MNKKQTTPILLICTSFLTFPVILTLIKSIKNDYLLITHSKIMFNFLRKFFPKEKIFLFSSPKFNNKYLNLINVKSKIHQLIIFKKKIKKKLQRFQNSDVFFFFESFAPEMAYAIKFLSKKNNIFFMPEMKSKFLYSKTKPNFKILLHKLYLKIIYGLDTEAVCGKNNKIILLYSNKYFKNIKAKKIKIKVNSKTLINFQKKNLSIKNKKILLLCSGESIEQNIISLLKFKKFIKKFVSNLILNQISFKRKNTFDKLYFEEKLIDEIPQFFPGNILIYNFKIIIGYHSALLFEAANNNLMSISLLDLLKSKTNELNVKHYKQYLIKNLKKNKKIYFPQSIEDLFSLIKNFY